MGGIVVYPKNNGGGGGTMDHQELENLQGGAEDQYFHLDSNSFDGVMTLLYKNSVSSISVAPAIGEKGVSVPLTVTYNILSNDDQFTAATINNGIESVLEFVDNGVQNVSGGSWLSSLVFVLGMKYSRRNNPIEELKTAGYTAVIPQWSGISALADFTSYAGISAALTKYVQSSPTISRQFSPAGQYLWFISTKNNALIHDGNNFTQTIGNWNDGVSEFYKKQISLALNDGTLADVYLYRTRNLKTFGNLTYKIS